MKQKKMCKSLNSNRELKERLGINKKDYSKKEVKVERKKVKTAEKASL